MELTGNNKPEYGKKVVAEVSKRLEQEYGSGFDKTSISRMIKFYQEFPDFEKVATLSQQLTWSHFVEILPIQDELKRDFYAAMCMQENWSVRTLRERKKSMLYERTAISKKPEETIKNEIAELRDDGKMSLDLFYRDPYMLDFLGLRDTYSEKDLENAILAELEKFILEMGSDFAFLARQKHFVLDGKDYYMEDILHIYELPYNENVPVICMDEKSYQLLGETREPIPLRSGDNRKTDSEYIRCGTCSIVDIMEELESLNTTVMHLKLDQRVSLGEDEAVIREFSINSITSRLKLECDKLFPEKEQYYVEITDMYGNKSLYSLVQEQI